MLSFVILNFARRRSTQLKISTGPSPLRTEALLRANLRKGQQINDAERLAMQLRKQSLDAALGVLEGLRPELNEGQRRQLDQAIRRVKR